MAQLVQHCSANAAGAMDSNPVQTVDPMAYDGRIGMLGHSGCNLISRKSSIRPWQHFTHIHNLFLTRISVQLHYIANIFEGNN